MDHHEVSVTGEMNVQLESTGARFHSQPKSLERVLGELAEAPLCARFTGHSRAITLCRPLRRRRTKIKANVASTTRRDRFLPIGRT